MAGTSPQETMARLQKNPKETMKFLASNPGDFTVLVLQKNPADTQEVLNNNPSDFKEFKEKNPSDAKKSVMELVKANPADMMSLLQNNVQDTMKLIAKNPSDFSEVLKKNPKDAERLLKECPGGGDSGEAPAPAPAPKPATGGGYSPDKPAPAPEVPVNAGNYSADAMCDGKKAEERVQWLIKEKGMTRDAAIQAVMGEFPKVFSDWWKPGADCGGTPAKERAQWLVDNKGVTMEAAKDQVRKEFPAAFGGSTSAGGASGDLIDGKFPHNMCIVQEADGPKLKISVTPSNPSEVTMVAVHYVINGGASMNFDINKPEAGTNTYVHITPNGGGYPVCPPGAKVSYWLAAMINGLIVSQPEDACPNAEARMNWTAP